MFRKITVSFLVMLVLLCACAPATPVPAPTVAPTSTPIPTPTPAVLTLTDGQNRTVTLTAVPQRIVSLAPSTTEVLFAVGAGSQVVGRDKMSDYPAAVKDVADIGSTWDTLNTERIVTLKPDLVVAAGINSPEQVKTLEDLGLTVYAFADPTTYDGVFQDLLVMGRLTGHTAEADTLVAGLEARLAAVTAKVQAATDRPLVFYEIDGSDAAKPWTTGPGTFMDTMLNLAGGRNIGADLKDPYAQISQEEIVKQDPDLIVLGDTLFGVSVESVGQRTGWGGLTAVKADRVYAFEDSLASRPGPRLVDGLEQMAKLLHPDLFK